MQNIFDAIPETLQQELIEQIAGSVDVRIERIVSHGHSSPEGFWYDQQQDEFVLLLEGEAELEFEDGMVPLKKGDYLTIKAHRKHRVNWTTPDQPTLWLAVYFPIHSGGPFKTAPVQTDHCCYGLPESHPTGVNDEQSKRTPYSGKQ